MADILLYGQGIVDLWLTEYYMDRALWIVADRVLYGEDIVNLWLRVYYMDMALWICG